MYFRRGSISIHGQCLTNRSQLLKDLQVNEILSQEETTILYLLAAKICSDEHRKASLIIKQKVLKMKHTCNLFKGNVRRLQAFLAMSELKQLQQKSSKVDEQERTNDQIEIKQMEVQDYLERAINSFQQKKCQWGLALSYLQEAMYLVINMQAVNQRIEEAKIISQNKIQSSTNPTMKQKSFKISNQALTNQLREEQKGLVDDFFSSIGDAIVNSQSIQHWKALSHCYRLVTQVSTEQKLDQAQIQVISDAFQPTQNGSILDIPDEIFMDARKKQREFFNLYKRNVSNNNQLQKAICIDREQGEDFSLMMEIVQKSQVSTLFNNQVAAAVSRKSSYMSEEMSKSLQQSHKFQCNNLNQRNTMPKIKVTTKSRCSNNNLAPQKTISESSEVNFSANSCLKVPLSINGSIIESISGGNRSRTNSQRVVKSKTKLNSDHENEQNDHSLQSSFDSTRKSK